MTIWSPAIMLWIKAFKLLSQMLPGWTHLMKMNSRVHTGQVLRKIVNATDFEFKDILRFATIFSHCYDFLRFSVRTPKICYALLRFSAIATIFYDFRSATENMLRFIYK